MDISAGLIAKGALGAGALAAAGGASYKYSDKIGEFISSLKSTNQGQEAEKEHETINKKLKTLGITETNCQFAATDSSKSCELDSNALAKVVFKNKGDSDNTVNNLDSGKKISLKIEKGYEKDVFPEGLRFIFKGTDNKNVEIGSSDKIILKQGVSYDFKIKTEGDKLESAWTLATIGAKVGVTCTGDSISECDLSTSNNINIWKSNDDYKTGGKSETGKKINVAGDSAGYNGGYKFTVTSDTSISEGDSKKTSGGIEKLTASTVTYEIDARDKDGKKVWFLVEKTNGAGA